MNWVLGPLGLYTDCQGFCGSSFEHLPSRKSPGTQVLGFGALACVFRVSTSVDSQCDWDLKKDWLFGHLDP